MVFMYKGLNDNKEERIGYINGPSKIQALNKLKDITDIETVYYFEKRIDNPLLNKIRIELLESKKARKKESSKGPSLMDRMRNRVDKIMTPKKKSKPKVRDDRTFIEKIRDFLLSDVGSSDSKDGEAEIERSIDIDWDMIESEDRVRRKGIPRYSVSQDEIIIFTKRLNMMLSSGISLSRALDILSDHQNKDLSKIIGKIIEDINEGVSFSDALAKFPDQFNVTYIAMITIGEDSGNIPETLDEIVAFMERSQKTRSKLKTASIYPAIIGVILISTMVLGSIFFIPQFKKMFGGDGAALPLFTRIVFKVSDLLPYIFIGIILFIIIVQVLRRFVLSFDRFIREFVDRFKLKGPIVKNIFMASYMYNVSSTIHIMISSGIRLKDTIDLTRRTIDNIFIQNDLANVSGLMIEGHSFSEALAEQPHIDQLLTSIVLTGEESGELEGALYEISEYYNYELNTRVDNAMETIQPVLMIIVGLVAIPVIIAIYLPIFDLSTGKML